MPSDELKQIRADVDRLANEYADGDVDRVMNLMRRVLDDGVDAVWPLMLAKKNHAGSPDFASFADNVIMTIIAEGESHETRGSAGKNTADLQAIARALGRISEFRQAGDGETAREIEAMLAESCSASIPTLESARKAPIPPAAAAILDRVIRKAKAAAKIECAPLPYDAKLGQPPRPALPDAASIAKKLGGRNTSKN